MRRSPHRAALTEALTAAIARFQADVRQLGRTVLRHELDGLRATLRPAPHEAGTRVQPAAAAHHAQPAAPAELPKAAHELQAQRNRLAELLHEHRGNVSAVGRALGKAPLQVRRWCRRFSLQLSAFRDRAPTTKSQRARREQLAAQQRARREQLAAQQRGHFIALLRTHRGNVMAVGRALGKAPLQVRRWCRQFDVEAAAFRE